MNEFQRQYIECSKRYREKEDADSVRALYALKEALEAVKVCVLSVSDTFCRRKV